MRVHTVAGLRRWRLRSAFLFGTVAALVSCGACATGGQAPSRTDVDFGIRSRIGSGLRLGDAPLPPDVSIEDGLAQDEAVAVALWNSPDFEASLADLGVARADLAEAGLLRNPILSLLFPVGPKQLEWTLQFPLEFWQRPRRVAAASFAAQAVGERLVSQGLRLVADARNAYVDAVAAERRVALASQNAELTRRIAGIAEARLRAGDISDMESRAAISEALQAAAELRRLEHEQVATKVTLLVRMGFNTPPESLRLASDAVEAPVSCGEPAALIETALSSRPDVRGAEISIEAAAKRASWERSRVFNLIATLDANGAGTEGYEQGPGFSTDLPIFARNQGGIGRAVAEVERAGQLYLALRLQVVAEVRTAAIRVSQAQQAMQSWQQEIVPFLEVEQGQAERAYQSGDVALLAVLDVNRRLVQARQRQFEASVDLQHASIGLDRSVGRPCARF